MSRTDEAPEIEQFSLFDTGPIWQEHWIGMPEFSVEDLTPRRSIIVHFETDGDVIAFEELTGVSLGQTLRSIWFPEAEITRYADKRYADA